MMIKEKYINALVDTSMEDLQQYVQNDTDWLFNW